MASLQREPTGVFHIVFRFSGTRYKRSLGTKNKSNANVKRTEIRETIDLLKRGRIEIPEDAQVDEFILSGGKRVSREVSKPVVPTNKKVSLSSS